MELVFLGTGGGRINLIKQTRGTGGFRINSASANIHVDPGPGALVHSVRERQDPLSLDCVLVTHNHIDHSSDAMALIEGMTHYGLKRRGIIIGSRNTIEGNEAGERGISSYHLSKAEAVHAAQWGERKEFKASRGPFTFEAIRMKHEEQSAFGFRISMDDKTVGHISDTEYMDSLGADFSGCDALVVNCMKPEPDRYKGHLCSAEVIEVLRAARPGVCVITHLGMKMLRAGPAKEAERIADESGVRTVAARDGMKIQV